MCLRRIAWEYADDMGGNETETTAAIYAAMSAMRCKDRDGERVKSNGSKCFQ